LRVHGERSETVTDNNRNLLIRVATAVVLLPFILWLIWLGGLPFALLISFAAGMCALELNLLPANLPPPEKLEPNGKKKSPVVEEIEEIELESAILTGAAIVSVGGAFLIPLLHEVHIGLVTTKLVLAGVLMIASADALLFEENLTNAPRRVGLSVLGAVYFGILMAALVRLRQLESGEWWIVLTLSVTWLNDTGAYFAGRAFGQHKLYGRVSPSKTWEGFFGGAAASIGAALVVQHFWLPQLQPWGAAAIGAVAAVVGPLGDLSESMLKRAFGSKDSGRLLPGHGGFFDRLDALLFVAPSVLLLVRLLT
jgi:phosphatidate cytidylyltransferase